MSVHVRFFASLREQIGFSETAIEHEGELTVERVWCIVTGVGNMPASLLAAVNFEYARGDSRVDDGDEVAFFPPVTGG